MKLLQCLIWYFKSLRNFIHSDVLDHEAILFVFAVSQQHQLHGTFSWVMLISLCMGCSLQALIYAVNIMVQ